MNTKTLFLVCFLLTFFNIGVFGQAKDKVARVVIDAGHGGTMPGAVGKLCKEKDINLNVALRLGQLISENFKDVTVFYTRKTDETVEVHKRAQIANKNKGDLFISIHCNAAENKSAHGVETFVMGVSKSEESMAIAKKENADMLLEKDYKTNYSDFDPNSPEAYIIFSLYSNAYRNSSISFASKVQAHLVKNSKIADRRVQEAGFWVLYKVAMPSILIELGFISNVEEEQYLVREETQKMLAQSIFNAFVEYKNMTDETSTPYLNITPDTASTSITTTTTITAPNDILFRIQFFTSKENLKTSDKRFSTLIDVKNYFENNVWKYTTGNYETLVAAQEALKDVKKLYADAFIIAFQNEQKITVQEAQKLLE
jgi:N-acetylmuramoyl-L-alanine amidase